jgi:hypothetical protein
MRVLVALLLGACTPYRVIARGESDVPETDCNSPSGTCCLDGFGAIASGPDELETILEGVVPDATIDPSSVDWEVEAAVLVWTDTCPGTGYRLGLRSGNVDDRTFSVRVAVKRPNSGGDAVMRPYVLLAVGDSAITSVDVQVKPIGR